MRTLSPSPAGGGVGVGVGNGVGVGVGNGVGVGVGVGVGGAAVSVTLTVIVIGWLGSTVPTTVAVRSLDVATGISLQSHAYRTTLSHMEALTPTISVRLPPGLRDQLETVAAKEDCPLSYIIRKALTEWLRRYGAPRDR
jgi:hypothetical protein